MPHASPSAARPRFSEQFVPKLLTVLREGYGTSALRADAIAGLTVAIVALPLSMAIAIASGVGPERGLYTAVIGGFLVSALGGSRFQIGGPAGAFIVLVAACVQTVGVQGLLTATLLSGLFLMAAGFLRLGQYVKFIPYPVTVGFTAGIAVIIFSSQIKDLFGLSLPEGEPSALAARLGALWAARGSVTWAAVGLAVLTIGVIQGIKHWRPQLPSLLIAVTLAALAAFLFGLPVETIGTRFGALPQHLPVPAMPDLSAETVLAALPFALSFTLLGAIESLLSAVVADGMSGRHHRSNAELVAQGVANVGSALFGGVPVTGTIARTATNVRAGAHGPVAGMLHALFVLLFLLIAAPLAGYIPLAALAAVLAVVAWNMAEKAEFWTLLRSSGGDALVLMSTFLLVIFRDLSEGIVVGFAIGSLLFIHRMSQTAELREGLPLAVEDHADTGTTYEAGQERDVLVYRIAGAFFFGAASAIGTTLDRLADRPRAFVLDLSEVPLLDSSAAHTIEMLGRKMQRRGGILYVTGARREVRKALLALGLREPHVHYRATIEDALSNLHESPGT